MSQREQILRTAKTEEDRLLLSRVIDVFLWVEKNHRLKATPFLNGHQVQVARRAAEQWRASFAVFGGYDQAERCILACYPDYFYPEEADYPVCLLKLEGRELSGLSHRDYLGSILGLGIVREKVGDIIPDGDRAYVFCTRDIGPYIAEQLTKIGSKGVKAQVQPNFQVPLPERKFKEISATLSSLRLDCVVSAGAGMSRAEAAEAIKREHVTLQWEPVTEPSRTVEAGQIISVKGVGRMELARVTGVTKKGRLGVVIKRYL